MATRKGRTGRKTKRMLTRTKSRRYKVRGGDNKSEMRTLAREIALLYSSLDVADDDADEEKTAEIYAAIKDKTQTLNAMKFLGTSAPTRSIKALSVFGERK